MLFVLGYIDPSSGSMLLQMIIGGALAVIYGGRKFISHGFHAGKDKLRRVFKRKSSGGPDKPDNQA
jgi:hypothetical protein